MALVVSRSEVMELLDMAETINRIEESFHLIDDSVVPTRTQYKKEEMDGEIFVMPGIVESLNDFGVKIPSSFPNNKEKNKPKTIGTMLLVNSNSGELEVLLDGSHLTNYRTGALGAVGARHLAPDNVTEVGVFGSSTQAKYQVLALDTELDLDEVKIYSRSSKKYNAVSELESLVTANVTAADTPNDTCDNSQIVVAATTSPKPVFSDDMLSSNTLVIGIGSNDEDMQEIPSESIERASHIYVDNYSSCIKVGDIDIPLKNGNINENKISSFHDLIINESTDIKREKSLLVFKSVGSIIFDISLSELIVEKAYENNIGTHIDLHSIEE